MPINFNCECSIEQQRKKEQRENQRLREENCKQRQEIDELKVQIKALTHYIASKESDDPWEI